MTEPNQCPHDHTKFDAMIGTRCLDCGALYQNNKWNGGHTPVPQPAAPDDPYPFDEVVDGGSVVRFNMDGNQWYANRLPFTDMMEMPVGFGDTPMQALVELIRIESASAPTQVREGAALESTKDTNQK